MARPLFRLLAITAALTALAACSESSPSGPIDSPASLARGSDDVGPDDNGGRGGRKSATKTEVRISLRAVAGSPFRAASGKAKFKIDGSERELQIEAEDVRAGTVLQFHVGGTLVGTATANGLGEARLNLNSTLGQSVPMSVTGQSVTVSLTDGTRVLAGSF